MSEWQKRRGAIRPRLDDDPLCCIPMLADVTPDEIARQLKLEVDRTSSMTVRVLDPYLVSKDLPFVVKAFASDARRRIVLITRAEGSQRGRATGRRCTIFRWARLKWAALLRMLRLRHVENTRNDQLDLLRRNAKMLEEKGVFADVKVVCPRKRFHDRYVVCTDGDGPSLFLLFGASLNQRFNAFSLIYRVTNNHMRSHILRLIKVLEDAASE